MKDRHFYSIDILRGWVAILVCLYHLSEGFLADQDVLRFLFSRGYLGVEIFFVISGFVIPYTMYLRKHQYSDTGTFLLKRLIRIEPPYWASILLIFLVDYISKFFVHYEDKVIHVDYPNLLYHILHINDFLDEPWLKGIYWSLAVEVQYYLFAAMIFPLIFSESKWLRYAFLFAFCMGRWTEWDHSVFYYGCHFVSGILFFQFKTGMITRKDFFIAMVICWGITFWCFDLYHLSAVIFAILVIYFLNYKIRPFIFLGTISYSFYLIHIQVAWVLMDACRRSYPATHPYYHMTLSLLAAIVASVIFYYLVERPSHKLAKRF